MIFEIILGVSRYRSSSKYIVKSPDDEPKPREGEKERQTDTKRKWPMREEEN